MNCKNYTIKICEGNEFTLLFPLKRRTYVSDKPIDEDIIIADLTDVVVKFGGVEYQSTADPRGLMVNLPATLSVGTYNAIITAKYHGANIRASYYELVTIVKWNFQSTAQDYIQGSPIAVPPAYVIGGPLTDAELEELKEELRDDIADAEEAKAEAEEAKEEYIAKAESLDNVAKQGTDPTATNTAIKNAIENIDIDTSALAQRTDVKDGNDTAISVAKEVRSEVGTGSDTAAESGTLFAVVKWVKDKVKSIFNLIGTPSITQEGTVFAELGEVGAALDYMQQGGMPTLNVGVPQMTIPSTTASQELVPNTCYIFAERSNNLTLTLGTPVVGLVNEYHCFIICGSTAPTITWPTGITWNGGSAPTIAADKTYEISILNNIAAYFEV